MTKRRANMGGFFGGALCAYLLGPKWIWRSDLCPIPPPNDERYITLVDHPPLPVLKFSDRAHYAQGAVQLDRGR